MHGHELRLKKLKDAKERAYKDLKQNAEDIYNGGFIRSYTEHYHVNYIYTMHINIFELFRKLNLGDEGEKIAISLLNNATRLFPDVLHPYVLERWVGEQLKSEIKRKPELLLQDEVFKFVIGHVDEE